MANEYLNNNAFEDTIKQFQKSKREKAKQELIIDDLLGSKKRRAKRKRNKKRGQLLLSLLKQEVKKYEQVCIDYKDSSDDLATLFLTLSENIVRYAKFQFIDSDDAVQEGVVICFEKVDRFDPDYIGKNGQKAKAFNYMTTCILNHFRQLYRTARNYQELKKKYLDHLQNELEKIVIQNGRWHSTSTKVIPVENSRSRMD
jgi:hypothetical protein